MITIKTLSQATEQEVFDQVARHLLTQKEVSRGMTRNALSVSCLYHADYGLKCAAGCLIGDDEYNEWFEGCGWLDLAYCGEVPDTHATFIEALQGIHDNRAVEDWAFALFEFAQLRGLNNDVIKEFEQ